MSERVAIIGAGVMGENHARTLQREIQGYELGWVVDPNAERAAYIAARYGSDATRAIEGIDGLDGDDVAAAIIVSPSCFHEPQALQLLENGIPVLVEKPVATSEGASRIDEAARREGLVAMVGHAELFNPTVQSLRAVLGEEAIRYMTLERLSMVTDSSRLYHGVVDDLMVHDISIALGLVSDGYDGNFPRVLSGSGSNGSQASPDPAEAMIQFGDGTRAFLRASRRYTGGKRRKLSIETDERVIEANLLDRTIKVTGNREAGSYTPDGVYTEQLEERTYYPSESAQPLTLEQRFFYAAINGEVDPSDANVSIEHARRVMLVAEEIGRIIRAHGELPTLINKETIRV